jgi:gamma-glutamylcyclotransferase (GGCT)/AIG2-like uncharacterized protein YtfP
MVRISSDPKPGVPVVPKRTDPVFRLFVYGTLKVGFPNHARFCASVLSARTARIRGRLFATPWEHPVADLPPDQILARGSRNLGQDWDRQMALETDVARGPPGPETDDSDGWIQGELMEFPDPVGWLAALDRFEEFDPEGGVFRFDRVLVPVYLDAGICLPAWVYAGAGILNDHHFPEVAGGLWR